MCLCDFLSAFDTGLLVQTAILLDNIRGALPEMQTVSPRSGIAMNPSNLQRESAYRTHIAGANEIAREFAAAHQPIDRRTMCEAVPNLTIPPVNPTDVETPPPGRSASGMIPSDAMCAASRYELIGEIARGGMGVLLRAHDRLIGRELVIKLLRDELRGHATAERRFLREARINGQLQHPGIVPIYDVGRFPDGRPYLTMRYVYGRTLEAVLAARSSADSDHSQLLRIFERVCETVAYAHAKGVIHRDLKPANVMVSGFGQVRVLDWGLAKVVGEPPEPWDGEPVLTPSAFLTQFGAAIGTPAFIPPEQASGECALWNERSDVFGLGGILCEIFTGQPPYIGETMPAIWAKARAGDLREAHERLRNCGADSAWVQLAIACLAPNPDDRPRSAEEVLCATAFGRCSR